MRKPIAIYGAGGFGRETALLLEQLNAFEPQWEFRGFFDDGMPKGTPLAGTSILGGLDDALASDLEYLALAIADGGIRKTLFGALHPRGFHFPALIHPSVILGGAGNRVGQGSLISAGTILTTDVIIDDFVIVNLAVTIGHDVHLHSFSSVMPACHLSGNVSVETAAYLGTGAKILQGVTIGHHAKVGAGAVVLHDVPPETTAVGVPARILAT